jgi:superfamily I DNA/RNA helicase
MPLNPSQETAVKAGGFQLILAGPGSGKTRVITEKILHLLDKGIPANQILALTFSDKAAAGMSDRIEEKRPHLDLGGDALVTFAYTAPGKFTPEECGQKHGRDARILRAGHAFRW